MPDLARLRENEDELAKALLPPDPDLTIVSIVQSVADTLARVAVREAVTSDSDSAEA